MKRNAHKQEEWFLDSDSRGQYNKIGYIFFFMLLIATIIQSAMAVENLSQLDNNIRHNELLKEKREATKKHLKEVETNKESNWRQKQFVEDLEDYEKKLAFLQRQKEEKTFNSIGTLLGTLLCWLLCLLIWSKVRKHKPEISLKAKKVGIVIFALGLLTILVCVFLLINNYPRISLSEIFLGIIPCTFISLIGIGIWADKIK